MRRPTSFASSLRASGSATGWQNDRPRLPRSGRKVAGRDLEGRSYRHNRVIAQGCARFWVRVLGFQHLYTWKFENTPFIENLVGVNGAEMSLAMVEGYGHRVELLEYQAPADRKIIRPRSCDVGSVHIALYIDDMDLALTRVGEGLALGKYL
jgi:hypothetical protein